jgi:serine-type D-Ala-D-Ala endopeptidase (penicillin-binding protein 7)
MNRSQNPLLHAVPRQLSAALAVALAAVLTAAAGNGVAADGRYRQGAISGLNPQAVQTADAAQPAPATVEATPDSTPDTAGGRYHYLALKSAAALVLDQQTGATMFGKNTDAVLPIASITKLMTAMVVLDAKLPMQETIPISEDDVDTLKGTRSRLRVGTLLTREELLRLALMASENRAAAALSHAYPGGREAFVAAMNRKAAELGMRDTHFLDPTGLTSANVSTAHDLVKLVDAGYRYPTIRNFTTTNRYDVRINGREQTFRNTNRLVQNGSWEIGLSKTGFINEAGRCLVMQARLAEKNVLIVLLDSWGKYTRIGDANRIRKWLESGPLKPSVKS